MAVDHPNKKPLLLFTYYTGAISVLKREKSKNYKNRTPLKLFNCFLLRMRIYVFSNLFFFCIFSSITFSSSALHSQGHVVVSQFPWEPKFGVWKIVVVWGKRWRLKTQSAFIALSCCFYVFFPLN
jgi:hypothetical protein